MIYAHKETCNLVMKMRLQEGDREFEHLFIANIDLTFGFFQITLLLQGGISW